jgi:hypothetical protein
MATLSLSVREHGLPLLLFSFSLIHLSKECVFDFKFYLFIAVFTKASDFCVLNFYPESLLHLFMDSYFY